MCLYLYCHCTHAHISLLAGLILEVVMSYKNKKENDSTSVEKKKHLETKKKN